MAGPASSIQLSGAGVDLSPRIQRNATVVGSPAASSETIVASITINGNLAVQAGIVVQAFAAFTIGTDGVSYNLKIRKTDASGSTLKATGVVDLAATKLGAASLLAFDTAPTLPGQVYVATLTVASGSAPSTVSAVEILAIVV